MIKTIKEALTKKLSVLDVLILIAAFTCIGMGLFVVHLQIMLKLHAKAAQHPITYYWIPMFFCACMAFRLFFPWWLFSKPMSDEDRAKFYRIM
jgi:hypothetical protein